MSGQTYRDLIAWQKSIKLVATIHRITREWPREELYGLTNQVRRAAISVPSNIAEGQGRGGKRAFAHYLTIAYGSLYEVETHIVIAQHLDYVELTVFQDLMDQTAEIGRLLNGLLRSVRPAAEISATTIPDYRLLTTDY